MNKRFIKNCEAVRARFAMLNKMSIFLKYDPLLDSQVHHDVKKNNLDKHERHVDHNLSEGICCGSIERASQSDLETGNFVNLEDNSQTFMFQQDRSALKGGCQFGHGQQCIEQ